jgi:alpha-tubulin suppressor-like RCC1 family protein
VQAVTLGNDYACALQEGRAFCWGTNRNGQLADNSHIVARPTPRPTKGNLRFRLLTAGDGFTCGIAVTEQTYCWGATGDGQLGAGIKSDSVHGALLVRGDHRFRMLSAGPGSTVCGIGEENHAYCWGDLARDTTGPMSDVPVRVSGALSFQDVSVGNSFACGLTTDSLAYCWGFDGQGSLGDSGKTAGGYAATPVAVAGGMRFKSISAGSRTACALDAHGRGYCWGWNEYGQVGDGTIVNRTVPTPISGGYVFREVRAGGSTTCGITFGGETMCWGRGADGELGNGASSGRSLRPVRVIDPSP